ncbi:WD repeat-containing protein 6 [Lampris incognitus]|uniref:WD repeat-containing protein 6 n=1 Tax=Lampris incognitus TaxID=2546036 RepID=UPI0024B62E16|nr:WD repeat-containing protein 6 [Lampris incognitus]
METAALVAPVTALEFLDKYLLAGEGPILNVYSLLPHPKPYASLSVLQHYRIHGIRPKPHEANSKHLSAAEPCCEQETSPLAQSNIPKHFDFVVFGGKAVRLVRLIIKFSGEDHLHVEALGPLMQLHDWALDVRWLSGERHSLLGIALAHNSTLLLDANEGKALVHCSCLDGCLLYSALLVMNQSWMDSIIVGGTVFNQLVLWRPGREVNKSKHKAPVERRLLGHSGVIFSISYLQEKGWLASASDDRSVRVWAVGYLGGPGGTCGDLNPSCLRVLYGHQARVFSVHLSLGQLFSAGEDGACLVWDWAGGGKVTRTLKGHRAGGVRALAVSRGKYDDGMQEKWVATGGADGGVRLWMVEGNQKKGEEVTETLTDLKFNGQGTPKVVCVVAGGDGNASWTQSKVLVCTDHGMVYKYNSGLWELIWQGALEFHSYCVMEILTVRLRYCLYKAHLCALGNLSGGIQVFPISQPQSGVLLTGGSGKIHSLIWVKGKDSWRQGGYLLASGAEGLVHRWYIEVEADEDSRFVLNVHPLTPLLLPSCAKRWLTAAVCHPSSSLGVLWFCGDRRGSLLLFQERIKTGQKERAKGMDLGSSNKSEKDGQTSRERKEASGSRTEEENESPLQPQSCLFGVHGKQGVTSVCEYQGLLYSTGRDGCVRVFRTRPTPRELQQENKGSCRIDGTNEGLQLEVLRVQRACKGMEWLERVLILEPEASATELPEHKKEEGEEAREVHEMSQIVYTTEETTKATEKGKSARREARFVIAGFHAMHFVAWDPVRQERLLAVPCGGGHRSWSLWPAHNGLWPGYGALVFIKQGAVLASQPPAEAHIWAGSSGKTGGWGLREGVHGKGIGCVCRLGRIGQAGIRIHTMNAGNHGGIETRGWSGAKPQETEREEGDWGWEILATGGEDTSLTILAIQSNSGAVQVLSVITDHISSIRTLTAVMSPERDGDRGEKQLSLSALLISAGGRAQMQCYRLLISWDGQMQVPSCQVIQVASHRLDEQWERRRNRHQMVKTDPETRYMSVAVVDEVTDGVLLALACSDGAVRLFSVSEVIGHIELLWESFYHQRCVLSVTACSLEDGKGNRYKLLFSAATDGEIAVLDVTTSLSSLGSSLSDSPTPPIPCLSIPAHQSGVNSLAVWTHRAVQEEDSCLVTVASGGDDGQLTVSVIRVHYPEGAIEGSRQPSQSQEQSSQQQTKSQTHSPVHLHLYLHQQSHVPLAHAAPLTALRLLSPGLLTSTSPDQRLCIWRVSSAGISHCGTLYSHVADAAGLAAWEEETMVREMREGTINDVGEGKKEGREELRINVGSGAKRSTLVGGEREVWVSSKVGLEVGGKTPQEREGKEGSETGGELNLTVVKIEEKMKNTVAEDEWVGRTAGKLRDHTGSETVNKTVCVTRCEASNESVCKTRDQVIGLAVGESNRDTDDKMGSMTCKTSNETRVKKERIGWVLVCGQGLQLIQVQNTETDEEIGTKMRRDRTVMEQLVKVTLPENNIS